MHPAHRRQALALLLAVAFAIPGLARADDALAAARQAFARANAGDASQIEPAARAFDRLSQARPGDPVLLAYAGAAEAMRATTTWLPWRKLRHADDGLARLDKALALVQGGATTPRDEAAGVPAVLETRFIAASTFLALPSMFNRQARGEALLAQVQADPLFAGAPAAFREQVRQRAGAAR
jgi:hypothetical protein